MVTPENPIRDAVKEVFIAFSTPLEGACDHMYPDKDGNITTAIGYLIDPLSGALLLPWKNLDGSPATKEQITAEWTALKSDPALRKVLASKLRPRTKLRLSLEDVNRITRDRMERVARAVQKELPQFCLFPADAQLAVLSMCWALGVSRFFSLFVKCVAALRVLDFTKAAEECRIDDSDNAGVTPRNEQNKRFFLAAAVVQASSREEDYEALTPVRPRRPSLESLRGVQDALVILGYDPGPLDGVWGPKTEKAVRAFQQQAKLDVDGKVGPKTKKALDDALLARKR